MRHQKAVLQVVILLGLVLFVTHISAWGSEINQLTDDRITVFYPSIVPEEFAIRILRNEEKALPYVENFLNVRYQGTVDVYITIGESLFGFGQAGPGRITYDLPSASLQGESNAFAQIASTGEVATHEMTHIVSGQQFGPYSSLDEGLAVAINRTSDSSRQVHPHFLSKGLLQIGQLAPIVPVWLEWTSEKSIYRYEESASFILFLIQEYGIESFKSFYRATANLEKPLAQPMLEQAFRQVYDVNLASVEVGWHRFLQEYAPGLEQRAEYVAQARLFLEDPVTTLEAQLDTFYQLSHPGSYFYVGSVRFVGPLPQKVDSLMIASSRLYVSLANDLTLPPGQTYQRFKENSEACRTLLEQWWVAVQAYIDARALMFHSASYDSIISKLQEAQRLYKSVGDEVMVTETNEYITAYQLVSEGESQLGIGNIEQARGLLRRALILFRQLNEPKMVQRIRVLLLIG